MQTQIKKSKIHGKGIFAMADIKKNDIIEKCPIIILNKKDLEKIDKTILFNYYFNWKNDSGVICLGNGSLYNHSYTPNAIYKKNYSKKEIIFKAIKDIKRGEEIFVNYNGKPNAKNKVWFDVI